MNVRVLILAASNDGYVGVDAYVKCGNCPNVCDPTEGYGCGCDVRGDHVGGATLIFQLVRVEFQRIM